MELRYELEILRRSLAMLTPGVPALNREEAMKLVTELEDAEERLARLIADLRQLVDQASNSHPGSRGS